MEVRVEPPSRVVLVYDVKLVRRALSFLKQFTKREALEEALEVAWCLSRRLGEEERRFLSVVQTIYDATKDGIVKPPEFDVFREYENAGAA